MEFPNFFFIFVKIFEDEWFIPQKLKTFYMKIIYNKGLPFPGFSAMTIGPGIFARKEYEERGLSNTTIQHEKTHIMQQKDFFVPILGSIIFYVGYVVEGVLKWPYALYGKDPYYQISFEREAYSNQCDPDYLKTRKRGAGFKRIWK